MSDFRSVAVVTATLTQHIQSALNATATLGGSQVTHRRPDDPTGTGATTSRVNVFLLQTSPNPSFRSADTPTRRGEDGSLIRQPRAPLDLHYLLSFYGDDAILRPHLLLGVVAATLHAKPFLTREMIAAALATPHFAFLAAADLGDEVERVKLTPMALSLEELSRAWSVFFQVPYHLSAAYQASVVFVDFPEAPTPAPPVLTPSVSVRPDRTPEIDAIGAADGDLLVDTSVLLMRGTKLRGTAGETRVRLTGDDSETAVTGPAAPAGASAKDEAILLPLAGHPGLRAGLQGVQVVHHLPLSDASSTLYPVFASDLAAFVLHPRVTAAALQPGGLLRVDFAPRTKEGQAVQAELLGSDGAVVFVTPRATPAAGVTQISLPTANAPTGTWRVRLRVDGAESRLAGAPEVTIP